jgi:hypothetical protein
MQATPVLTEVLITAYAKDKAVLAVDLLPDHATTVVLEGNATVEVSARQATPVFAELVTMLEGLESAARCCIPD